MPRRQFCETSARTKIIGWQSNLIGDVSKKTPKDAIGSTVFATIGKVRQRFDVLSGASYASQSDQTIHIGLGNADKIDKLEVVWANGQTEVFPIEKIDTQITLEQNKIVKK